MITVCSQCKNRNKQCSSPESSKSWDELINKPECIDYEGDVDTKHLEFREK